MKDPEARRRLKEMLEFQMNEKKEVARIATSKKKAPGRPPVRQQTSLTQSQSTSLLPPLNVNRQAQMTQFAETMTPTRKAQGYTSLSQSRAAAA